MTGVATKKKPGGAQHAPHEGRQTRPLRDLTEQALQKYFKNLNGHRPDDLYALVLRQVEQPLLKTVLDYTGGNQTKAADILGINRGTLRKKLRDYDLCD